MSGKEEEEWKETSSRRGRRSNNSQPRQAQTNQGREGNAWDGSADRDRGRGRGRGDSRGRGRGAGHDNQQFRPSQPQTGPSGFRQPNPNRQTYERSGGDNNKTQSPRGNFSNQGNRGGYSGNRGGFQGQSSPSGRMPSSVTYPSLLVCRKLSQQPKSLQQPLMQFPVLANFYRIVVSDIVVEHYDVTISVSEKQRKIKKQQKQSTLAEIVPAEADEKAEFFIKKFSPEIFAAFKAANPAYFTNSSIIYDGYKGLYVARKKMSIPENGLELLQMVMINGREKHFKIKLKHVESIDLSVANTYYNKRQVSEIPERVFSVLEIIFKQIITDNSAGFTCHQRKYFDLKDEKKVNFDPCFEFVRGFLCSVRPTQFGLALNVHLKATGIINRSFNRLDHLVAAILELCDRPIPERLNEWQLRKVNDIIKSLVIFVNHGSQKMNFKVAKLTNETPAKRTFTVGDSKDPITTYDYFRAKYPNVRILPNLPMVMLTKKQTYMPLDLCLIKDPHFMATKLLKDQDVQDGLLAFSTLSPTVYFNTASQIVKRIDGSGQQNETKRDFGLDQFSIEAVSLNAHQLTAPKVLNDHPWNDEFYEPKKESINYVVVSFDPYVKEWQITKFVNEMVGVAKKLGLNMPNPKRNSVHANVKNAKDVEKECNKIDTSGLDLVFFVFPKLLRDYYNSNGTPNTEEIYNVVKRIFDQKLGIMSQGINSKKVQSIPKGYFNNFLLKVNAKLNGRNTVISEVSLKDIANNFDPSSTMLVGVDVFHPGSVDDIQSSVSAAIGSYDERFTRYSASIRVQKKEDKDQEMIVQMEEMMVELLKTYKEHNKRYPSTIFIFRDGVSEGQLDKLKSIELAKIEAAVKKVIGATKTPTKLSLIVVQKRHHTRFACVEERKLGNKSTYNVPKGTVVDTMIVDPEREEFYLASHDSPMGTTKPTKYIKIRDDLHLSMANLQKLCYYACHQCSRTRLTISIPTAIRYADLCAYRSGQHIRAVNPTFKHMDDALERERLIISELNKAVKIDKKLQDRLYYV